MDMQFGPKEETLRTEVRSFLQSTLKDRPDGESRSDEEFEFAKGFNAELGKRGWIAPAWPKLPPPDTVTLTSNFPDKSTSSKG